jgi:hypothetical protein
MRFHDYKLDSYTVSDYGARIVLELKYEYPGTENQNSHIEFTEVTCYHFNHTTGAIITEIEEVALEALVVEESALLESFAREHGLAHWETDVEQYLSALKELKMRAWRLESAIGFSGFIIGRDVAGTP